MFLIICLITPFFGTYIGIHYEKKQIRKQVKNQLIAGIDKSELVLLKFSTIEVETKLEWEHSKEFEYQGEMYDVVIKEINTDSISYWCWLDDEETVLNRKLQDLVANAFGANPQNKEKQRQLLDFFKSLYHSTTSELNTSWYIDDIASSVCVNLYLTEDKYSPPVPPPEIN